MLAIEPSGGVLGATVRGLDLAQPLGWEEFGQILLRQARGLTQMPQAERKR